MDETREPPKRGRRRTSTPPTRPVTVRMDVALWERLTQYAPRERRSVGNLLQMLAADGLDALDRKYRVRTEYGYLRELMANTYELLSHIPPDRVQDALRWQESLLRQLQRGRPIDSLILPRLPLRPRPRRRR